MLASLVLAALAGQRIEEQGRVPACSHDRVIELELTAEDPALIDGQGPAKLVAYPVEFSGTLHVWARSELDLYLRVDEATEWSVLAEDDGSSAQAKPYLRLEVERGDRLMVLIAASESSGRGALELRLAAAPETEATREAVASGRRALAEAALLREAGDWTGARQLLAARIDELAKSPGVPHSELASDAFGDLGRLAYELGSLAESIEAFRRQRDHADRTLPARHPEALRVRTNLALAMGDMGDLPGARSLQELLVAAHAQALPEDHPTLLRARMNLASTLFKMGDYRGSRAILESTLEVAEHAFSEEHLVVQQARLNLAAVLEATRDLRGARALGESVLAVRERTLHEEDRELLIARSNLAFTLFQMGELEGARALQESVLAVFERTLPRDHFSVLIVRSDLALTMHEMGDLPGARALQESVLAAREGFLPPDHMDLVSARMNLANTLNRMGDARGALPLQESVLASLERMLPPEHETLLSARNNLAATRYALGDYSGARELNEAVLASRQRLLRPDHPDLVASRSNLALTLHGLGEFAQARALEESVLAARERDLPEGHPDLLRARTNLALTMLAMGDLVAARALVPDQIAGMLARLMSSLALAPRQAREAVGSESERLRTMLLLTESTDAELLVPVFELLETMRVVVGEAARAIRKSKDPEIEELLSEARLVRTALNDLALGAAHPGLDEEQLSSELTRLLQERDRLEREASRRLAARGVVIRTVEVALLAQRLGSRAAAIGFRRVAHAHRSEETGRIEAGGDHLQCHVLLPDGSLTRIDLGPASELEELVALWRAAMGAPLLRGVTVVEKDGNREREREAGEALRERLLDPVLASLGEETRRLHVCADDFVFLVPLDALPIEGERVGDRWRFVNEVSFARLLEPSGLPEETPGLLALGGVDYDAGVVSAETIDASASDLRSRLSQPFAPLLQTRLEAEATVVLFADLFGVEPVVLTHQAATKRALFQHAPGKRYLHLATHGWFAPARMKTPVEGNESDRGPARMALEERLSGMAPMLLCGLALAGANQGNDARGQLSGIVTAEELCSLDLSACELAVLSACETNVGIRAAGQGIQSLQAAVYAAGAMSSITSLWKVDDAVTRRLMELFYTGLWGERLGKTDALWHAKRALREEGHPTRDWAGWVLTGDPD